MASSNWAALLEKQKTESSQTQERKKIHTGNRVDRKAPPKQAPSSADSQSPYVALDCEMVGVGEGGVESSLARCSVVGFDGQVLFDKYVRQQRTVTDYRTHVSGIRASHLLHPSAVDFKQCQQAVAALIRGRVLVGHALNNDLACLLLEHPPHMIRDTAHCKLLCPHKPRALKVLVQERLNVAIQTAAHDSVEDARWVMALFKSVRKDWEKLLANKAKRRPAEEQPTTTIALPVPSAVAESSPLAALHSRDADHDGDDTDNDNDNDNDGHSAHAHSHSHSHARMTSSPAASAPASANVPKGRVRSRGKKPAHSVSHTLDVARARAHMLNAKTGTADGKKMESDSTEQKHKGTAPSASTSTATVTSKARSAAASDARERAVAAAKRRRTESAAGSGSAVTKTDANEAELRHVKKR